MSKEQLNAARPPSFREKPGLVPTVVAYLVIALIVFTTIGLVISRSLSRISTMATETRDTILPEVFEKQRTAVNLERLGRFAETVYRANDPEIRREYKLAARILSQDSVFGDPEVNRQVVEAYRDIDKIARLRYEQSLLNARSDTILFDFNPGNRYSAALLDLPQGNRMTDLLFLLGKARNMDSMNSFKSEFTQLAGTLKPVTPVQVKALAQAGEYVRLRDLDVRLEYRCRGLWTNVNTNLEAMADNLSIHAAGTADKRFTLIAAEADRALYTGLLAIGVITLAMGILIFFAHRDIVVPIIRCVRKLDKSGAGEEDAPMPPARLRELHNIKNAVERSTVLMTELADRTTALQQANDALEAEIAVREKTQQELALAKERAEAADQAKSDFLAGMSHEIRTPMNTILGMAELMLDTKPTTEQRQYIEIFQSSGEMLLAIINDVLDLSKIEAGEIVLEKVPIDLGNLLERTREMVVGRARQKGLEFTVDVGREVPTHLMGDPVRLRQVLVNLIDNGVKFTEQGSVRLGIHHAGDGPPGRLTFTVSDTGIGIPPAAQSEIFNRFTQADASTTRKYGGTGLGLAICSRLVKLMGGNIGLESVPGQGATFHFTLEFALDETTKRLEAQLSSMEELTDVLSKTRTSILIAEDSESNQALIELYFKDTACSLDFAGDGRQAVQKFSENEYDLVLMDIQMPVMDGHEATRAIRDLEQRRGTPPTPIIAVTANAFKEDQDHCIESGCSGYLAKPISKQKLLECVANHALKTAPGR